jgi:pyrroloquinoline-quinone synthase
MAKPVSEADFVAEVNRILEPRYIDKHPFMRLFYEGRLTKKQMQAWIVNRFYLQNSIASKDAAIVSNCPLADVRRIWISRTLRREGMGDTVGDVDGWLELAEAAGLRRESVLKARCLPGVRFAVEGLVSFARRGTWLDGVATSLYELPAKRELVERTAALKEHYHWIKRDGMRFFVSRLAHIERDTDAVVGLVMTYAKDRGDLRSAIKASLHMSDVIWSIHDAIYMNYVAVDSPLSASL